MLISSRVAPGKPEILHYPNLPEAQRKKQHGRGSHSPIGRLTVSQPTTVTFEFVVGERAVVEGGSCLIVWRWPFDWSDLQTATPAADGYVSTKLTPSATRGRTEPVVLSTNYQWIGGIEPWHHFLEVRVQSGNLKSGDTLHVVCGDTSGGSHGWSAPTCAARRAQFLMLIDHLGNGQRARLVDPPEYQIHASTPIRLAAFCRSDGSVDEPITVTVRTEDCWGNATNPQSPTILRVAERESEDHVQIKRLDHGSADATVERFEVTACEPGCYRFLACGESMQTVTNPLSVCTELPPLRLFWGDLHSGQTTIGCGAGSLSEHYAFGRDCAGLQFITHQANDHYVTLGEWKHTREVTDQFYEIGKFVTFLGCEWSAFTADGGDRNVFYRDDEPHLRRSDRFFEEQTPDPEPDLRTASEFHDAFRDRDVLVNIHVGGRPTNLQWYEPKIEKLCEIHSTHGTSEWFVHDVLSRGYRVGITAGTDGVTGRPGACHPGRRLIRNLRGGLTAVYAPALDREALWNSLQQRCCYGTTGERIRLWFELNGAPMGSELTTDGRCEVLVRVTGTGPIECVELLRGTTVIHAWQVAETPRLNSLNGANAFRLLWGGTQRKGTARLQRVCWDGSLSAESGEMELLQAINPHSCQDRVVQTTRSRIEWNSATAGNASGFTFTLLGNTNTRLLLNTEPLTCDVGLNEVLEEEVFLDAGGVGRFIKIGPAPREDGPSQFEGRWMDENPPTGESPYWVRVTQIDQAKAWSSPVYVTR
jgi:hypothetical protein